MIDLSPDKNKSQKELTELIESAKEKAENQILRAYYISVFSIKMGLAILTISALFGFSEKFLSLDIPGVGEFF